MHKMIIALVLLGGLAFHTSAQQAAVKAPTLTTATSNYNPGQFKEKSAAMATALKAGNFEEAQKLFPSVQGMIMLRADNYMVAKKTAEEQKMRKLGADMKSFSQNMSGNKERMLQVISEAQAAY